MGAAPTTPRAGRWWWLLAVAVLIFGVSTVFDAWVPMQERPLRETPRTALRHTLIEGTWHAQRPRRDAELAWLTKSLSSRTLDAKRTHSRNRGTQPRKGARPQKPPPPIPPAKSLPRVTVGAGERLWNIAERTLGHGSRWPEIVTLNPGLDPKKLREGRVLKLPADARIAKPSQEPAPKRSTTPRHHIVAKGETLSAIAGRYYTDGRWRRIFEANRDRLENPARVPVGTRLRIPPQNGTDRL